MTHDEIVEVVNRRSQGFADGDASLIADQYARHAILESPVSGVAQGRDAIRAAYERLLWALGPLDVSREELLVDGDRVVFCFAAKGTHSGEFFGLPATGKQFTIHGVTLMTFEAKKIVHERRVHDFTGLLVTLGVLKARPQS